ncbi:hypothetical protein [Citrobacter portucalensis]|uniref:hypothetical protein n=1 Tax=Citrobacter portucalensis TaxID=1639133 RepID=UPI000FEBAAF5|nr:hypothetical protein [Citrobacter portucalensis]RWT88914.1 hypothetical protein DN590_23410 [Citrobacter freundii]MDV0512477.1 hypothetical protein [Citrobacter portucalensis]MDV0517000.1 hypothetical protein [Citrobacter portucalensis]MDV0562515.1 hypothetical protein [Citrobacter portucalensis]MEB0750455.1 hypothetical protein [Citrobacter portucalensis]
MSKPKRKIRGTNKTKLIICEGISDKKFVERLKVVLHKRDCGFTVRVDQAAGGGPKSAILHAINYYGDYDFKSVFIDSDLPIPPEAKRAAINHRIDIFQSRPHCLEGLLLKMMGHNGEIMNTALAKELFYKKYDLANVVTQEWYDENIDVMLLDTIINDNKHCCCDVIKKLHGFFASV